MQHAQSQESEVQTLLNNFVGISTTTFSIMTMHGRVSYCTSTPFIVFSVTYTICEGPKLDA